MSNSNTKDTLKGHQWGYADTSFTFLNDKEITVTGSRYPISGRAMPYLVDHVCDFLKLDKSIFNEAQDEQKKVLKGKPDSINPDPILYNKLVTMLSKTQVSYDEEDRLIHSHGQLSVSEIYTLMYESNHIRTVDFVVYPENQEQVLALVSHAKMLGYALIPYGGGTNVSGALMVPDIAPRKVISVDLSKMDNILYIDKENHIAYVQTGIKGSKLEALLNKEGFTFGHEPDSIEFSTLGGWIATNSSGMKRAKYGNIEDLVLDMDVITAKGLLQPKKVFPRHSSGISLKNLFFGSEGNLGIITAAYIKIDTLPETSVFGALLFKDFETGVAFLKGIKETLFMPASIRLVNNAEFLFGQSLKPKKTTFKRYTDKIRLFMLEKLYGMDIKKVAAAIYVFEGSASETKTMNKALIAFSKKYKALDAGPENGKTGYGLTFSIAYIRDFFQKYSIIGETFETSTSWDNCLQICNAVQAAAIDLCKAHGINYPPYLGYRVTQSYANGVCLYFTLAMYVKEVEDPVACFNKIEAQLRAVIIQNGGSVSHHHGIGKIRKKYLPSMFDENTLESVNGVKNEFDPQEVFCARNGPVFLAPDGK